MEMNLSVNEIRVLACLVEKSFSTPEYYPLTLNSLTAACNQKSNRDPEMLLGEKEIVRALDSLRDRKMVWAVTLAGSRVPKYRHSLPEVIPLSPPQLAVLCELMLRGPQTVGELRTRASRLFTLSGVDEVQGILKELSDWPGGPLAGVAPRRAGQREERYAHLLGGPLPVEPESALPPSEPARLSVMAENDRIAALETRVASLEDELARLKAQFADFAKQFQ